MVRLVEQSEAGAGAAEVGGMVVNSSLRLMVSLCLSLSPALKLGRFPHSGGKLNLGGAPRGAPARA